MAELNINGQNVQLNDEGYLVDSSQWTEDVAKVIAKEEGIDLTDKHFKVLEFLRSKQASGDTLTIRSVGKSGIIDIKEFYQLFPGGPLKKASRISGIPKPSSCV